MAEANENSSIWEGVTRVGDLQINQDLDFEQRDWRFQRFGWAVLSLIVVLALSGLFAFGPLSGTVAGAANGALQVEYQRFGRRIAPQTLEVRLGTDAGRNGRARVWISRDYLEHFEFLQVTPSPETVIAGRDRLTYVFRVPQPGEPTAVTFHLQAERPGWLAGRVGLENGPSFPFRQLIYP